MATLREMREVIDSVIVYDERPTEVPPTPHLMYSKVIKDSLRRAMQSAEYYGVHYNGQYGMDLCTVWVVGAYEVTYLTDDEGFHAGMLTDEMMDDLIIEEV